jgi:hypothetical protein
MGILGGSLSWARALEAESAVAARRLPCSSRLSQSPERYLFVGGLVDRRLFDTLKNSTNARVRRYGLACPQGGIQAVNAELSLATTRQSTAR